MLKVRPDKPSLKSVSKIWKVGCRRKLHIFLNAKTSYIIQSVGFWWYLVSGATKTDTSWLEDPTRLMRDSSNYQHEMLSTTKIYNVKREIFESKQSHLHSMLCESCIKYIVRVLDWQKVVQLWLASLILWNPCVVPCPCWCQQANRVRRGLTKTADGDQKLQTDQRALVCIGDAWHLQHQLSRCNEENSIVIPWCEMLNVGDLVHF